MFPDENLGLLFCHYTMYANKCEKDGKVPENFLSYFLNLLKG